MEQKGNEDLFRYIIKASKEMEDDDEKRFNFVRSQISSLEDCMKDGPNKRATIKSLANWAVKEFTTVEKFKNDRRMLDLWKLLGKYSENMGMEGVLENLHRIGFFKDCPEFYLLWAEHWAMKGKLENFNKIMQICEENCPLNAFEAKELFKPLLIKHFDLLENSNHSMDEEKTMDLIKMLADRPEDVRSELTLFPFERTIVPDAKHKDVRRTSHQNQVVLDGFEHHQRAATTTTTNCEEFSVFKDLMTSLIHQQPPTETTQLEHFQTKKTAKPGDDLIRTMPKLKIGSTIEEEVSEEKENTTTTSNTNSAFSSPFRKKTKLKLISAENEPSKCQQEEQQEEEKQLVDDKDESTHTGMVVEKMNPGTVNPWDEQLRREVLANAPQMSECYQLPSNKCPRFDLNRTISLGGEQFVIDKLLGEGGFAHVYKAKSLNSKQFYGIKYESPSCPWEVYICSSLRRRLPSKFLDFVMQIRDAYIFRDASAIVYDYYPHGSLLDLENVYKKNGTAEMNGLLATYFGIHLGRILEQVHAVNIIHGDVKPDNIMLTIGWLDERKPLDQLLSVGAPAALKLIDWGRSIDMEPFPAGLEFIGRAGTENFDCHEMTCGMPWTYQTDYYGFVASIYVLLRGEYLQTFKHANGNIIPKTPFKRRMALYDLWQSIIGTFLNIPNCKELPRWSGVNRQMEEGLKAAIETELGLEWRKAVERFNVFMKQQMSG